MKPKRLVERLKPFVGAPCSSTQRRELALTVAKMTRRSTEENDLNYVRTGDSIAVCLKIGEHYHLMLCTVNLEASSDDLPGGDQ